MSNGTTAATWFETHVEFERAIERAQQNASRPWDMQFMSDLASKADQYGLGCFLSPKQLQHLCRIADLEVPERLPDQQRPAPYRTPAASRSKPSTRDDGDYDERNPPPVGADDPYDDDIPF